MPSSTSTLTVNDPDDEITFGLSPALVTLDQAVNGEAESYRALRTHIMARHVEGGRRALAVCAPTMGAAERSTRSQLFTPGRWSR